MVSAFIPDVLIADDEPICRDVLEFYLENLGCRVQAVCDGDEALAAYTHGADRIGLVVLDARMPGPSPLELYKRIRRISPRVPVLFCSGVSPLDPIIVAINACGLQLLPKPFNRSDLFQAILRVLKRAETGVPV